MKRKGFLKKALIYTVIGATVAGNIMPALAYTNSVAGVNETQDITESQDAECEVYAQLGTDFRVIIPKKLTLSGSTKKGAYTVDVEGDIGGTDVIKVVPEESFTLTSTGLASQTAKVSQDKTAWSWNEILADSKTIGNGSIEASGITAGAWNGSFWFNISLDEGIESDEETQHTLTLSDYNVKMGTDDSVQVNAYLDGKLVNEDVTWVSDNENIIITDGLVETTASAEVGDTATVTVTASNTENLSAMASALSDLGIVTYASAAEDLSIDFVVTIVDIEYSVEEINLKAGESIDVTERIIPETVTGTVTWSQTAISGINLVKNGNTVTVKIASDMEAGKSYNLVATYGDYSKTLKINIVADEEHTHSYTSTVTTEATCTEDGVKTFTCECGDSYTEVIPATGHNYVDGACTECGKSDTKYTLKIDDAGFLNEVEGISANTQTICDGDIIDLPDKTNDSYDLSGYSIARAIENISLCSTNINTGDAIYVQNYGPVTLEAEKTRLESFGLSYTDTNYSWKGKSEQTDYSWNQTAISDTITIENPSVYVFSVTERQKCGNTYDSGYSLSYSMNLQDITNSKSYNIGWLASTTQKTYDYDNIKIRCKKQTLSNTSGTGTYDRKYKTTYMIYLEPGEYKLSLSGRAGNGSSRSGSIYSASISSPCISATYLPSPVINNVTHSAFGGTLYELIPIEEGMEFDFNTMYSNKENTNVYLISNWVTKQEE